MIANRVRFIVDLLGANCPECGRRTREAVLVNPYGLVLARRQGCVRCGHRHRLGAQPGFGALAG